MKKLGLDQIIEPVVTGLGYELVGTEFLSQGRHSVLRIYIDQADGITVDDCETVSRQISAVLDVEDPIQGNYTLEVSSPGLDRPLFTVEHFIRFLGSRVSIRLRTPLESRRKISGVIKSVENDVITLAGEEKDFNVPFDVIDKANLVPDFQIGKRA